MCFLKYANNDFSLNNFFSNKYKVENLILVMLSWSNCVKHGWMLLKISQKVWVKNLINLVGFDILTKVPYRIKMVSFATRNATIFKNVCKHCVQPWQI